MRSVEELVHGLGPNALALGGRATTVRAELQDLYGTLEEAKADVGGLFAWARAAKPTQPLTAGVWRGDWSSEAKLSATDKIMLSESDVISFHSYETGEKFEQRILSLQRYNRPLLCTEYMARGAKSTFEGSLPIAKKYNVAAINWGFVQGKTQTHLPWDSWQKPYVDREPEIWFHEVFRQDGSPYRQEEVDLIRSLTGVAKGK